jgi:hypothetical protein
MHYIEYIKSHAQPHNGLNIDTEDPESKLVRKSFSALATDIPGIFKAIEGSVESSLAQAKYVDNPNSRRIELVVKGKDHCAIGFIEGFALRSEIIAYYTAVRLEYMKLFGNEVFTSVEYHVKKHEKYVLELVRNHSTTTAAPNDNSEDAAYMKTLADVIAQMEGIHQGVNFGIDNPALVRSFARNKKQKKQPCESNAQ